MAEIPPGVDPAAVDAIRALCGWHIAPVITEEIRITGNGTPLLLLPTLQLREVLSVSFLRRGLPELDIDLDQVGWEADGRMRARGRCWPTWPRSIRVEIEHGYDRWPDALTAAAEAIARSSRMAGYASVAIGQVSVQGSGGGGSLEANGLDPYVASILARYTLPPRS